MKKLLVILLFSAIYITTYSQKIDLQRVEPSNWWVGMQDTTLQLLVYGQNISATTVEITSKTVIIQKINKAESPNYLFIDLIIPKNAIPENFDIIFKSDKKIVAKYNYVLLQKKGNPKGFSSKDVMYLIMSDRFANGDPNNDSNTNMPDKSDRKNPDGRHGGDIQGVINNLDYFNKIGITALWLTPVIENNMDVCSYHGYASTDYYKVDPRMGSNDLYKQFVDKAHAKGIKVIQDVIYNHCGTNHWWMKDLPFSDWINFSKDVHTTYRAEILADIHSSEYDKKIMSGGWFVDAMPDMNQHNPYLAKYFIQNTIWWIEFSGIDGLRIDTYVYPFPDFMNDLTKAVHKEYPNLSMVGETWLQTLPSIAVLQSNSPVPSVIKTDLNSVTDFALNRTTDMAFNENDGWLEGVSRIFYTLTQDFLYARPNDLVIFLDNHDLSRFYSTVGEDMKKYKMGLAFILTTRGIPVLYYGSEIAMNGLKNEGDGALRKDFPGGWTGDSVNIFTLTNLSEKQKDIYDYSTKILNWRKNNNAVKEGDLLHFVPFDNVYVYFRYTNNEAVMVVMNNHPTEKRVVDCERFNEILKNYNSGIEITSGKVYNKLDKIEIDSKTVLIIDLKK